MVYFRASGRMIVNIHSANTEGAVGNYSALSKMFVVRRRNGGIEVSEEPVISGNMVKHWHAIALVEKALADGGVNICEQCSRKIMYRSTMKLGDELEYVKKCIVEDLHGFLNPDTQVRRESLVKFSFLVPVEEGRGEYEAVTHNRVVVNEKGQIPAKEQAMMVFKREHASGVYGFSCSMDLEYVGKCIADPKRTIDNLDERKKRAKLSILALADVLSGRMGAAQSRAQPIVRVTEAVIVVSKKPIPNLVHGFYTDYSAENIRMLKALLDGGYLSLEELKIFVVGGVSKSFLEEFGECKSIEVKDSVYDALLDASAVVEEWLK